MNQEIQLLQFFICREFDAGKKRDTYTAEQIQSNVFVPSFPFRFDNFMVVTCWRKDQRFHKEVLEYSTDDGIYFKTLPMDIEPAKDNVMFRWHKHAFPSELEVTKNTFLSIKVILDWKVMFESYLLIEKQ